MKKLLIALQAIFVIACSNKKEDLPQPAAPAPQKVCNEYSFRDTAIYYPTGEYITRFKITETCDSVKVLFSDGETLTAPQPTERPDSELVTSKTTKNVIHVIKTRGSGSIFYYLGEQGIYVKSKVDYSKF